MTGSFYILNVNCFTRNLCRCNVRKLSSIRLQEHSLVIYLDGKCRRVWRHIFRKLHQWWWLNMVAFRPVFYWWLPRFDTFLQTLQHADSAIRHHFVYSIVFNAELRCLLVDPSILYFFEVLVVVGDLGIPRLNSRKYVTLRCSTLQWLNTALFS